MENRLSFDKVRPFLGEWADKLQPVFETEEMYNLYQEFKRLGERGKKVTPTYNNLYRFLTTVSPSQLHLLIIGMDSYPGMYFNKEFHATGVAFDCSNSPDKKCQPSLVSMMKGIGTDLDEPIEPYYDLSYITDQGVMLGNRALNCKLLETGSFMGKWDFFWEFFLQEVIAKDHIGVPILLLGKDADKLRRYIFEMANPVYKLEHPSHAARNNTPWETKGVFKQINNRIVEKFGEANKIIWDKVALDKLVEEVPF